MIARAATVRISSRGGHLRRGHRDGGYVQRLLGFPRDGRSTFDGLHRHVRVIREARFAGMHAKQAAY